MIQQVTVLEMGDTRTQQTDELGFRVRVFIGRKGSPGEDRKRPGRVIAHCKFYSSPLLMYYMGLSTCVSAVGAGNIRVRGAKLLGTPSCTLS